MPTRSDLLKLTISVEGKEAEAALKRFERSVDKTTTRANESTRKAARGFSDLRSKMLAIGAATASISAAVYMIDRLADRAQRVTNLANGFDALTRSHNLSADTMLRRMRPAARGLVTDMELMRQANTALLLGLPVTEDTMGELTEAAVKLGRAMGVDATRSLESLIVGIGRQSRLWLDNLGIIVDTEQAYKDYAAALGVTVDQLTEAQKKQAFFNATMEQARAKSAELGDQTLTLAEGWQTLTTQIGNATNALLDYVNTRSLAPTGPAGGVLGVLGFRLSTGVQPPEQEAALGQGGPGSFARQLGPAPTNPFAADVEEAGRKWAEAASRYLAIYNAENFQRPAGEGTIAGPGSPAPELGLAFEPVFNTTEIVQQGTIAWREYTDAMMAAGESQAELASGAEWASNRYLLLSDAMRDATDVLWNIATSQRVVAREVLNSIARQVYGAASAIAIENVLRGFQEQALAAAALASFNFYSAGFHQTASKLHFATAAKAGAIGGAALAIGAATSGGGGGGGAAVGGSGAIQSPTSPEAPGGGEQQITVIIEGQGIIYASPDEVARIVSEAIKRQDARSGVG